MRTLVIAEHDGTKLDAVTRHVLGAASILGGAVDVLVAGWGCAPVAQDAAKVSGVCRVLLAEAPHCFDQAPENMTALVLAHASGYSHVLAAATAAGKNFMPRLAAVLDVAQISDIVAVESADTFVRPIYAGNVLQTVRSSDAVKVVTVRPTAFAAAGNGGCGRIESVAVPPNQAKSRVLGRAISASGRPELRAAQVVVAGGRGLGSAANFCRLLEPLADCLGAALGTTRAAVDAGYAGNELQIGQTGKIVAPRLYLAIGLSGAIQHWAGMRDSALIVAINKDAQAPICQLADYCLVADLFEAVPALTCALQKVAAGPGVRAEGGEGRRAG